MMKFLFNFLCIIFLCILNSGCTAKNNYGTRIHAADSIAKRHNFKKNYVKAGKFLLTSYQKITDPSKSFVFYIEGDGTINNGRYWISDNPTPKSQMLFGLAVMDKRPNVVYLARPCQYTPRSDDPHCDYPYWLDKRMSEEVIKSMNEAVTNISDGAPVDLVGFSGGGGVAILIASENDQISSIITISGNLDHHAFSRYNQVRPMIGSLNPIDYAKLINDIPQLHLSGAKDTRVPPFIAESYVSASKNRSCVKMMLIEHASHTRGWDKIWNKILDTNIKCD